MSGTRLPPLPPKPQDGHQVHPDGLRSEAEADQDVPRLEPQREAAEAKQAR